VVYPARYTSALRALAAVLIVVGWTGVVLRAQRAALAAVGRPRP
jgi:hypothetical protein